MTNVSEPTPATPDTIVRRDHAMEVTLARLLTAMMIVAATVIVVGVVLLLTRTQRLTAMSEFKTFTQTPRDHASYRSIAQVWAGVTRGEALAVMQAGLVLLIATPVLRVAATAGIFAKQRDWLYVAVTLVVLISLGVGLAGVVG